MEGRVIDHTAGGAVCLQGGRTGEQRGPSHLRKVSSFFLPWPGCGVGSGVWGRS